MAVFRILLLLLLMSVCLSAQSAPDNSSLSPQFEMGVLAAPPEFRAKSVSTPLRNGQDQIGTVPLERLLAPSPSQPDQSQVEPFPPEATSTCFYIRTYRVKRDEAESDITTPAGYSECQPATVLKFKTVVDPPVLVIFP
jgi:hypothetical protein